MSAIAYQLPDITLKSIGFVRNEVEEKPEVDYPWKNVVSEIEIDNRLTEALSGLEDFSHIIVLFWTHQAHTGEFRLKTHPRGDPNLPLVGRLATRSPNRPNRIAETTVRLLQRQGNILRVQGLDALDSSPVIDIKPYFPRFDTPAEKSEFPKWATIVNK